MSGDVQASPPPPWFTAISRELVELGLDALDDLALAVISTDMTGVVTGWNRAAEEIYGYASEEAVGRPIEELTVGPLERAQADEIMGQLGQGLPWAGKFNCKRRSGGFLTVSVVDLCVVDESGAVCGIVGLSREEPDKLQATLKELRALRLDAQHGDAMRTEAAREIAARLHDDLSQQCHQLVATTHEVLQSSELSASDRVHLEDLRLRQEQLVASLQNLWGSLRPPLLDDFGARAALEQLATNATLAGISRVDVGLDEGIDELSTPLKEVIVLVAQEAIANVVAHAHASQCSLTVTLEHDSVVLEITDNGVGIKGSEGFGTRLMRDRVQAFGGFLEIQPGPAGGTTVLVELEQQWSKLAPLESLIDPHVIMKAVRDESGEVVDFVYTEANDAAVSYNRTTRAALVGSHLMELLPGHRNSGLFAMYAHTVDSGEPLVLDDFVYPNEIMHSDRRYDIRAVKVGDSLSYTWRDVTERHELLEDFKLLAENASDVVYRLALDGTLSWISPSVERVLGWRPDDLVGHSVAAITHPDDVPTLSEREPLAGVQESVTFEARILARDGEYHWCSFYARPVLDQAHEAVAEIGNFRIIDAEHLQRELFEASEERYRLLAENSSDVIAVANSDGVLEWVSQSVTSMLGWLPEQLVQSRFADLVHPDDADILVKSHSTTPPGGTIHNTVRVRTAAGDYRWITTSVHEVPRVYGVSGARLASWRDAQAEVEATLALGESESRFRLVAEHASDVVFLVDKDDVIRWASPSVATVLGWQPSDLVGRSNSDIIAPRDLDVVHAGRGMADAGGVGKVQLQLRQPDGTLRWCEATTVLTTDEANWPSARVVSVHDIEAEVAARDALRASEARFRLLAENSTDIVYESDENGAIVWISSSVQRVLGWDPKSLIGTSSLGLIHEDDQPTAQSDRERVLRGESSQDLEIRFQSAQHRFHWMSVHAQPVRGRGGRISSIVVGLRLVDREVAAREALAASEAQFKMLAENASDIVFRVDDQGSLQWISSSVELELGWPPDVLVGRSATGLIFRDDHDKVLAARALALTGVRTRNLEIRMIRKDGECQWTSADARPLLDESGRVDGVVVSARNCHNEVLTRRAFNTLSEASQALVLSEHEDGLLHEMCEVAVKEGGYRLAWYGRKVYDDACSVAKVATSDLNRDYVEGLDVRWDDGPQGQGPTGRAIRLGKTFALRDFRTDASFAPWKDTAAAHDFLSCIALPVWIEGKLDGAWQVYASEPDAFAPAAVSMLESLAAEIGFGLTRVRDRSRLAQLTNDQVLLSTAIEQAGESVVLTDPEGSIIYANPAASLTSGYGHEELMGAIHGCCRADSRTDRITRGCGALSSAARRGRA